MDFDPSLENNEGRRYFAKVYQPNVAEEVPIIEDLDLTKIDPNTYPRQNLYDHIIQERGFRNLMGQGQGITCLRTGFDPAQQRELQERIAREGRLKEHKMMIKELHGSALFSNFMERFKQEGSGSQGP
jgi:hypothetical protein